MMKTPLEILHKYWGFTSFREFQEEIIQSILVSNDTVALLPTGGGKSICYQVPGLILAGCAVVIKNWGLKLWHIIRACIIWKRKAF